MNNDQRLIAHVSERSGLSLELEAEVSNRRGAKMLKLAAGERRFGLKVATKTDASTAREAAVLQELRDFTPIYVDSGDDQGFSWLLLTWVAGQSVYRYVKELRDRPEPDTKPKRLELFAAMFAKVAELHAAGYLHGDLQPDHFRWTDNTVQLLDFALTHHTDEDFDYPGALVHFSAPEVCAQQLAGSSAGHDSPGHCSPVRYDEQAELYSLAAVVFFLYTGQLSVDYGNEDAKLDLEKKRERIAQGHRTTFVGAGFEGAGAEPRNELERILEKCLSADKRARYGSVAEAAHDLSNLVSSRR